MAEEMENEPDAAAPGGLGRSPPANAPVPPPPPPYHAVNQNVQVEGNQNDLIRMLQTQQDSIQIMNRSLTQMSEQNTQQNNALLAALNNLQAAMGRQPAQLPAAPIHHRPQPQIAGLAANGNGNRPNDNGHRTHHLKTSDVRIPTYIGANDTKTPYDYILELEKYRAVVGYSEEEM